MYNQNMFVIPPADWKYIRRLFTPVFSSAKLKVMVRYLWLHSISFMWDIPNDVTSWCTYALYLRAFQFLIFRSPT